MKTDFRSRLPEVVAQALERRKALAVEKGWHGVIILFSTAIVFGHPPGKPLGSVMEEVPDFEANEGAA